MRITMKISVVIAATLIAVTACGSKNEFVSSSTGLKVTFPCNYSEASAGASEQLGLLPGDEYATCDSYGIRVSKGSLDGFRKQLDDEKKDRSLQDGSDNKDELIDNEATFLGQPSFERIKKDYSRSGELETYSRKLYIVKGDKIIQVGGEVERNKRDPETVQKEIREKLDQFFSSIQFTK
jgi:hypothetical protein